MQISTVDEVAALVRDRRRELRMSQSELAERAGVSRRWLQTLESGKTNVDLARVLPTLRVLGMAFSVGLSRPGVDLDEVLAEYDRDAP